MPAVTLVLSRPTDTTIQFYHIQFFDRFSRCSDSASFRGHYFPGKRLGITEANPTIFPPDNNANFSKQCTSLCLPSVGRRVKLEMDTANHVGLPLMLPFSPLSPSPAPSLSPLDIHSTDINTDLYSFTRCGLHHRPGRGKGQEGRGKTERIRLSRPLGFCYLHPGKRRQI